MSPGESFFKIKWKGLKKKKIKTTETRSTLVSVKKYDNCVSPMHDRDNNNSNNKV